MEVRHSTCGPHEDTDIIFGPVRHFGWHSCSTPSFHKLSAALNVCSCQFHIHWVNIQ